MINLTWFESEQDLQKLTGLDHNGLWDAGFDLDDWDFGFATNEELDINVFDYGDHGCGYYYLAKTLDGIAYNSSKVFYDGKYYYMSYHS